MGPTGEMVQPLGDRTPEELSAAFAEQARALEEGGVDFFLIESMSALEEVRAAVEGIRSVSALPIAVTMTFEKRGRTMMGVRPEQAVAALEEMGVRFIGANCGNGPAEMEPVMQKMVDARKPGTYLIASANAGLPTLGDDGHQHYDATPEIMAAYAARMREMGVNWVGACCGSAPEHIAAMSEALGG